MVWGVLQESKFIKFLGFMWNPLSWVMEAAAIMAIALANGGVSAKLFRVTVASFVRLLLFWVICLLICNVVYLYAGQASGLARFCGYHYSAGYQFHH